MCVCRTVYVKIAQFSGVQTKFLLDLLKIDNIGEDVEQTSCDFDKSCDIVEFSVW